EDNNLYYDREDIIIIEINKSESEIKSFAEDSINFQIKVGKNIDKKIYNYNQKLLFKNNDKSKWKDELELSLSINLKNDINEVEDTESPKVSQTTTTEPTHANETPVISPSEEPKTYSTDDNKDLSTDLKEDNDTEVSSENNKDKTGDESNIDKENLE
ncbi:MAG: hypothetical protein ABF289_02095, partial [Clostridiales bacterium]